MREVAEKPQRALCGPLARNRHLTASRPMLPENKPALILLVCSTCFKTEVAVGEVLEAGVEAAVSSWLWGSTGLLLEIVKNSLQAFHYAPASNRTLGSALFVAEVVDWIGGHLGRCCTCPGEGLEAAVEAAVSSWLWGNGSAIGPSLLDTHPFVVANSRCTVRVLVAVFPQPSQSCGSAIGRRHIQKVVCFRLGHYASVTELVNLAAGPV